MDDTGECLNKTRRRCRLSGRTNGFMRPYRGAGGLFYRVESGTVEVLLGKRRYRSCAGHWSVPGGRSERGRHNGRLETPIETALRETEEEIGVRFHLDRLAQQMHKVRLLVLGIFCYTTFILPYPTEACAHCGHEFTRLAWFRLNDLPGPLHHGVMRAVRKLRSTYAEEVQKNAELERETVSWNTAEHRGRT